MEKIFPETLFSESIRFDTVYYETRNFLPDALPFSLHTDYMVPTPRHYVHKHREIELLMAVSGKGQVIADLKTISLCGSEIAVIHPNKVHYVVSESVFTYYCLIIDSDFLVDCGIDPSSLCFEDHIISKELTEKMHRLQQEWSENKDYRNLLLRALLLDLVVHLCRHHLIRETMAEKEGPTLRKIKQSINFIKNHFRRDLTLDEIAAEAGLSKYHFCREFKKATDLTPIEFINRTRCEYAKNLLESQKYSVTEISEMCGFRTASHFSKTFRGFFGVYPSDYVRNNQKVNPT